MFQPGKSDFPARGMREGSGQQTSAPWASPSRTPALWRTAHEAVLGEASIRRP
jgi:hypothetical protein